MGRRMWMALGAAAVLVAPAACGSTDDGDVATGGDDAAEQGGVAAGPTAAFMSRVAENTADAPAFRFSMDMEAVGVPELGSGSVLSAEGVFTDDGQRGQMTIDMSGMFDAMGGAAGGAELEGLDELMGGLTEPWEIVVDGGTTYIKGGMFAGLLGADTAWVSMPSDAGGADPTGGLGDPTGFLDLLGEAGDVAEVGTEDVGGTTTTHYSVVIDAAELARSAADGAGQELPDVPGLSGTEMTIDVWVDEQAAQVRRMVVELDGSSLGAAAGTDTMGSVLLTMEITPLDEAVEVEVPDAAEVTPAEELGGGLLGGLGG